MKTIKNENGFGLIEILVASGLLSFISVVVMNMVQLSTDSSKNIQATFDINSLIYEIEYKNENPWTL